MTFASREDAGKKLGCHLRDLTVEVDVVLGLPRGGVIVAAEVAHVIHRPLDALIVRKIGHPLHREFAVGAIAENGVLLVDREQVGHPRVQPELKEIIAEETNRMREYESRFHPAGKFDLSAKRVLLVDDGLATGSTTEAAVESARRQNAVRVLVAAPVASASAIGRLSRVADEILVLWIDPDFDAVGSYYEMFSQVTDEEVLKSLKAGHADG